VLSVSAVDKNGNDVFTAERLFMPVPQRLGRGDRMGRGPYEKSGLLADTSLPPLRTITTDWEIFFPEEEVEVDGEYVTQYPSDSMDIAVKLWYMPYGVEDENAVLWREFNETVKFEAKGW
jgi:hypothetical protein